MSLGNKVGLHSRPAAAFVKVAKGFRSSIQVKCADKEVDGKNLLAVLWLGAGNGASVTVEARGDDAREAVDALGVFIRDKFGERE